MFERIIKQLLFLKLTILFVAVQLLLAAQPRLPHPQERLFGSQHTYVKVGTEPQGRLAVINPEFAATDFGVFRIPSLEEYFHNDPKAIEPLRKLWSRSTRASKKESLAFIPPETGRGLLLPESTHPEYRDILLKGTGPIKKFTANNKLRFHHLGFDGYFEISEALRDMAVSETLDKAGVWVSRGLGVVDLETQVERTAAAGPFRMGHYARAYRVQTRLSNLVELTPAERKAAIDDAIGRLNVLLRRDTPMTYTDYFNYMNRRLAKTAAIYQAIGYTQDSLHNGQVTLAGEVTDLGVGTFEKPTQPGAVNTKYPWFRYERQPALFQNMTYRTHALKAEPHLVELAENSEAFTKQTSLLGMIRSFSPESADGDRETRSFPDVLGKL